MATRKEPQRAGTALTHWVKRQQLESGLRRCEIALRWHQLVGARVAERTQPRRLDQGVLTVEVSSSAWLNELTFLRERLRRKIDRALGGGRVNELRLVLRSGVGRRVAPRKPPPAARPSPSDEDRAAVRRRVEGELPRLADDELRHHICQARQAQLLAGDDRLSAGAPATTPQTDEPRP